eukprot:jgi/Hompol1/1186/HPOL_005530-RA
MAASAASLPSNPSHPFNSSPLSFTPGATSESESASTGTSTSATAAAAASQRPTSPLFVNDVVNAAVASDAVDSMVSADMSRVLVIYTGGTIGMQNTPQHGYKPVKGYITATLARMMRFHDQGSGADTSGMPDLKDTNTINLTTIYPHEGASEAQQQEALAKPSARVINGTIVEQMEAPALISPPSLYGKRIKYSIIEYDPLLDSSNITMSDWIKIATDIEVNYRFFDAFIILHGTDTMAYTASALSFMLEDLGKTVIVTGSQVPLAEVRNDAVDNLLGALTIAGHFVIPEVGLFFDNKLFRGNRSSKVNAVEFNAFDSPNLRPLVNVGINIDVSWSDIWRPKRISRFRTHKAMNPSVAALRLFPGITDATVKAFLSPPIAGVVLETYGAGNAPTNRPEILKALKEASDRGVVIVNCTQCKRGLVSDIYETGKALTRIGIVPGADMTPECALTKLSYLLAKYSDVSICRKLMRDSLRGELTIPVRRQRFTYLPQPAQFYSGAGTSGLVSSVLNLLGVSMFGMSPPQSTVNLDPPTTTDSERNGHRPSPAVSIRDPNLASDTGFSAEVAHAGNDEILSSLERAMIPILLCQAARVDDTSGLKAVLSEYEFMANVSDYDGRSPLHVAASEGHLESVSILLTHGANLHMRDRFGRSVLYDAVHAGHQQIVQLLREAGAHFAPEEEELVAHALCTAALNGDIKRFRMLVESGANLNRWAQDGRSPLHLAVSKNHVEIVKFVVATAIQFKILHSASSPSLVRRDEKPSAAATASASKISTTNADSNADRKDPVHTSNASTDIKRSVSASALLHDSEPNLELVDHWGNTPMDDAKRLGFTEIADILSQGLKELC